MQTVYEWTALVEIPAIHVAFTTKQLLDKVSQQPQVFQELLEGGLVKLEDGSTRVISTELEDV